MRIQSEFNTYAKGFLNPWKPVVECPEGAFTEGIEIRRVASLLEKLRRLLRFTASARCASPKGCMAVGNIDSQPS